MCPLVAEIDVARGVRAADSPVAAPVARTAATDEAIASRLTAAGETIRPPDIVRTARAMRGRGEINTCYLAF